MAQMQQGNMNKVLYVVFFTGVLLSLAFGSFVGAYAGYQMSLTVPEPKPKAGSEEPVELTAAQLASYFDLKCWTVTIPDDFTQEQDYNRQKRLWFKVINPDGSARSKAGGIWTSGWKAGDKLTFVLGASEDGQLSYALLSSTGYIAKGKLEVSEAKIPSIRIGIVNPGGNVAPGQVFYKYSNNNEFNLDVMKEGELGIVVDFQLQ